MATPKKGLGRGLGALLYDNAEQTEVSGGISLLKISDIEPNREQARRSFDESALSELADSILLHGVVQPIIVRRKPNGFYGIIAGERRWRASKMAGLSEIPAIVKDSSELEASEISLIENLQRENLNPIEEASGYRDLMESHGFTQEEAAKRVGKSRAAVANILRLLKLPGEVIELVRSGSLSAGHARALIPLSGVLAPEEIYRRAASVASGGLSVRQTEQLVKRLLDNSRRVSPPRSAVAESYYRGIERRASSSLGRKVNIKQSPGGKGQLVLSYSGSEDLERLITELCGGDFFSDAETE